jgi:hypothetical protein
MHRHHARLPRINPELLKDGQSQAAFDKFGKTLISTAAVVTQQAAAALRSLGRFK